MTNRQLANRIGLWAAPIMGILTVVSAYATLGSGYEPSTFEIVFNFVIGFVLYGGIIYGLLRLAFALFRRGDRTA